MKPAQALQREIDRWQHFAPCAGANVAVLDGALGAWSGACGLGDVEAGAPMAAGARFYIYSITKTFIATRLLQLGVELDRPIASLLEIDLPEGVTVRRLLNHTAGMPSYTDLSDYLSATRESPGHPWTPEEVLRRCCRETPLDFAPGEGWHYSNTGYLLLAQLLERLSGTSLRRTIAEGILEPLDLRETYVAEAIDDGHLTPGYCRQLDAADRMRDVMRIYHPGWCLTGLMVSTAVEVARFLAALMGGKLLAPPLLAAITTPVPIGPKAGSAAYGLGLMMDPGWGHGGLHGHGGDGPGANAWAMHLPDFHGRPVTLVALCNTTMGGHPIYLMKDLLRVLEGVTAP